MMVVIGEHAELWQAEAACANGSTAPRSPDIYLTYQDERASWFLYVPPDQAAVAEAARGLGGLLANRAPDSPRVAGDYLRPRTPGTPQGRG